MLIAGLAILNLDRFLTCQIHFFDLDPGAGIIIVGEKDQVGAACLDSIALFQPGFFDAVSIDEGAVQAPRIFDPEPVPVALDRAMSLRE